MSTNAKAPAGKKAGAKPVTKAKAKPKPKAKRAPRRKPIKTYLPAVCEIVAAGNSVRSACGRLKIDEGTFRSFLRRTPEANDAIGLARDMGCDAMADECIEIADDSTKDKVKGARGEMVLDTEHVQRSRIRIDTRLRLMGKWSQRYGDKVALTGADGGAVKVDATSKIDMGALTDEQLRALATIRVPA